MNRNNFYKVSLPNEIFTLNEGSPILALTGTENHYSGNFCDNNLTGINSPYIHLGGMTTGNICNNRFTDFNVYYASGIFIFPGTFTGKFTRNIFERINLDNKINYTKVFIQFTYPMNGEISYNLLNDINIPYYAPYASGPLVYLSTGADNTGTIKDNNFSAIHSYYVAQSILNIAGNFLGDVSGNIFDGSSSRQSSGTLLVFSRAYPGNVINNKFINYTSTTSGTTAILTSAGLTGTIRDNNFSNNINTGFYTNNNGTVSGRIYNNLITDSNFHTTWTLMTLSGVFSGQIYNNKFINLRNFRLFQASNAAGEFYNNLISNVNFVPTTGIISLFYSTGTIATKFFNNTFFNAANSLNSTLVYNGGVMTSAEFRNNIFANVRQIWTGNSPLVTPFSNNAYYNVTVTTTQSKENDQNTSTGFSADPFVGDNSDRNFLLNNNPNGGAKLVNTGYHDSNSFYMNKTTQPNNSLDRGTIDIGYHYDQNAPYTYILSPNRGESVSGNQNIDFNIESNKSQSELDVNLYYSPTTSIGTLITNLNLSDSEFTCTSGPIYYCRYNWDASDVTDGNYYAIVKAIDSNGSYTDASDSNFNIISIPKLSLRTYSNNLPRSFFATGEDVNIIALTNSAAVTITITDSNGNIIVNQANMSGSPGEYYYTFPISGEYGWMDVKISGKTLEKAIYHSKTWIDKYTDYNSNVFPFSFDLNVQEPNTNQRWFWIADVNVGFLKTADFDSIRVLDYNGTNYLEIPSQVHEYTANNGLITSGKIMFLVSTDRNENRQFFVSYSRADSNNAYENELTLNMNESTYTLENSNFTTIISGLFGGVIQSLSSKLGSNQNLAGSDTMNLDARIATSASIFSIANNDSPEITIDRNELFFKKISARGTTGSTNNIDYNLAYTFYTKQPYYTVDLNMKPNRAYTTTSVSDEYFFVDESLFSHAVTYLNGATTTSTINASGDGSEIIGGDSNYYGSYKRASGDGYGVIKISSNSNKNLASTSANFTDDETESYFAHKIYSGGVDASTYFNLSNIKTVFNSWNDEGDLNEIYFNIKNPLTYEIGTTLTGDNTSPAINEITYSPTDTNDSTDLNFLVSAMDNLLILSVDINAIQIGNSFYQINYFENQSISTQFLIPDANTHAGDMNVTITVTDIAGNTDTNTFTINLTDITPPSINEQTITPDGNANWDPNTQLTIQANITEYSTLSTVNLMIRQLDSNGVWGDYNILPMNFELTGDNNYDYNATIDYNTPSDSSAVLEYKINTIDSFGNDSNSETNTIYSFYDYTWNLSTNSFTTTNGVLDSNINLDSFNVTNTGDMNLTFNVSSNWDYPDKVYFNQVRESEGYNFTLAPDENIDVNAIVTTKSTERTDTIIVTINPTNSNAIPDLNTLSGTIISFSDGPFMHMEMVEYPVSVTQEDTGKTFNLKVTNKGNQPASTVDINWIFPNNWIVTFGETEVSLLDLAVNDYRNQILNVTIGASALTGNQPITVTATPNSDTNRTKTKSVTVLVNAKSSSGNTGNTGGTTGGAGSAGGSGGSGGGGGGSLPFGSTQQKDLFFQTSEFFELVRGQDNSFDIKFTNPLEYKLVKLNLSVQGILATYLNLENSYIEKLDSNEEFNTQIEITSPKYFNPGEYELIFNIDGYYQTPNGKEIGFKEQRNIKLLIHDTNKELAQQYLNQINLFIEELSKNNYKLNDIPSLYKDANNLFNKRDYDGVKDKFEEAQKIFNSAIDAAIQSQNITGLINLATNKGLETPNTNRLLALAQLAFQRGDYALALSRLKEAELTYSVETKGELNLFIWFMSNIDKIVLILILAIAAVYLFSLGYGMIKIDNQITQLNAENNLLLQLIADVQKKSFIENKISLGEYYDALSQFETRIAQVSEKFIQLTTRKNNILTFSTQSTKLKKERKSLIELVRDSQKQYFSLGLIETRVYQTKLQSLTKRLSEVDEQIITNDLTKTLRINQKGIKKYFWKFYYNIFK